MKQERTCETCKNRVLGGRNELGRVWVCALTGEMIGEDLTVMVDEWWMDACADYEPIDETKGERDEQA